MAKVLFLCRENSCRSRMAQAFADRFGRGALEAASAGTHPAAESDSMMKAVMRERGFDIGDERPAGIDSLKKTAFDIVVHFGCLEGEMPAGVTAGEILDWGDIPDPKGKKYAEYRAAREEIGRRVMDLIRRFRKAS